MDPVWERSELIEEAIVMPRRAFAPLPDLRVVERPGWVQIITPSFKHGGFNEVALSVLDELEADAIIDATIAEYRRLGIMFRWSVGPGSKPDDLAERLAQRGLEPSFACAMARATDGFDAPSGEAVRVDEITTARELDVFTRVMAQGWAVDRAPLDVAHDLIFRDPRRTQRLFLASYQGQPAGIASYVAFPRSAYLLAGVVLPEFRRRGVYRALVDARLKDASSRGLSLATTQAREQTSAPLLERMGFETICRFQVFHG